MKAMIKFLKRYNELWLGPIAFILFWWSNHIVRDIDPQAIPYSMDAIQKIIFGHAVFACCSFSAMLVLRFTYPPMFTFLVDEFNAHFNQLTLWEKSKVCFCVFVSYLLGLILCMQVL